MGGIKPNFGSTPKRPCMAAAAAIGFAMPCASPIGIPSRINGFYKVGPAPGLPV
eukprot:CAMPEP_0185579950 /NCGR_PEP_ID=MMETSP0434-20130131/15510_1 /TAXON_ID=626734 ORGANISM="Favella taraikaensis, Strain Fe Narragansett Bay" /NCGR_SAMPLE_ID=MMETSP0434 /ASSEMBLY_ACC=CAM_ASM_000379 /LENGTH=53 /DNA_ID=CAMNT_0028198073 /DNA_START=132 /DNA_END=293 /DNA_ORIENTATION=+